ncbi:MAG: diphosphomevalonate decarboxylase [Nitrososphaerota archaeon]
MAEARAFVMEGLIKYHGLKDWGLRIPYHDSISVNLEGIGSRARVELRPSEGACEVLFEGSPASPRTKERVLGVLRRVWQEAGNRASCLVSFQNFPSGISAKGLGFSSSMGAALAAALFEAYGLRARWGWDLRRISALARLFSGSACRSVVGGFARWRAGQDHESSYAIRLGGRELLDLRVVVVPLYLEFSTEQAHREAEASPFFRARVESAQRRVEELEAALRAGDFERVGLLAELDALELHAVTMTGPGGHVLLLPSSVAVMREVRAMREEGIPAYFSLQTGPTVFINTLPRYVQAVEARIRALGLATLTCGVGGEVSLMNDQ